MSTVKYIAPGSLDDALKIKGEQGERARPIVGGTDLILRMKEGVLAPGTLLDLKNLWLDRISFSEQEAGIGACVTVGQMLADEDISACFPALLEACIPFAGPPIRNRATIGGNLVNASPAADLAPPLIAYDARVRLASASGDREVALHEFFSGPAQTVLGAHEILTGIHLPLPPAGTAACFIKLGPRRSMAISVVNVCARLTLEPSGRVAEARVVLGAVAPTPVRAASAEAGLTGQVPTPEVIMDAAASACADVTPISDVRAGSEYRLKMTKVLARRALQACVARLGGSVPDD